MNTSTLQRLRFQTTLNYQLRQLTHYVDKLQFVHLFDQVNILEVEMFLMHLTNSLTLCNTYSNLKEQSKVKNANCQTYSSPQILDTSSV